MGGMGSYDFAVRNAGAIETIARRAVDTDRPKAKQADVISVDLTNRVARVIYVGESESVPINFTSVIPKIGQRVVVDGRVDDRHVTEVLGAPEGIGSSIYIPPTGWTAGDITSPPPPTEGLFYWIMPSTDSSPLNAYIMIPPVWTSYNVDVVHTVTPTGAGEHFALQVQIIEVFSATFIGVDNYELVSTSAAANRTNILNDVSYTEDIHGFTVQRIPTDPLDTSSDSLGFLGLILYSTT